MMDEIEKEWNDDFRKMEEHMTAIEGIIYKWHEQLDNGWGTKFMDTVHESFEEIRELMPDFDEEEV